MGLLSPGPMGSRLKMSDSEGLEYFRRIRDGIPESSCTESHPTSYEDVHMQRFLCVCVCVHTHTGAQHNCHPYTLSPGNIGNCGNNAAAKCDPKTCGILACGQVVYAVERLVVSPRTYN